MDEMVGCHHRLNEREFERTPGDSEGQGGLVCCSPWSCKEQDTTERLNNNPHAKLFSTRGPCNCQFSGWDGLKCVVLGKNVTPEKDLLDHSI